MPSIPPILFNVVSDIRSGILAEGVHYVLKSSFGITSTALHAHQPASQATAQKLLIADFTYEMGQADKRRTELLKHVPAYLLIVIMPVVWDDIAIQLTRAGARAILYPDASTTDLSDAIQAVAARRTYLPSALERSLAQRYLDGGAATLETLTAREMELFRGLARGLGTGEVATALNISVKTADTHRANLLRKLGVRNNVELAHLAFRYGIIPL